MLRLSSSGINEDFKIEAVYFGDQKIESIRDIDLQVSESEELKWENNILTSFKGDSFTGTIDIPKENMFETIWGISYKFTRLFVISPNDAVTLCLKRGPIPCEGLNSRFVLHPYIKDGEMYEILDEEIKKYLFLKMFNHEIWWYEYDWNVNPLGFKGDNE